MKRFLCLCLCLLLLLPTGCGARKINKYLDDESAEAYKKSIEVLDAVLNKEMDIDKAAKRIKIYADSISETEELLKSTYVLELSLTASALNLIYIEKKVEEIGVDDKEIFLTSVDFEKIKELKSDLEDTLYD